MLYTFPLETKTNFPPFLTHASEQSLSVILASLCISIILPWLAPHMLSLIMPVIVMLAAPANEAKNATNAVAHRIPFTAFIFAILLRGPDKTELTSVR